MTKLQPGDKFTINQYGETWEYLSSGVFPNGDEYLNFNIIEGKNVGAEISHINKEKFIELISDKKHHKSTPLSDCCDKKLSWDKKGYYACEECGECCDYIKKVLLEDEYGGSYTLKYDDKCIVLTNNKTKKLATHFFMEAIDAIKMIRL